MTSVVPPVEASPAGTMDFEIRGVLRVRTHGGGTGDLAAVARDLGPPAGTTEEPPDLIVHFVDDLSAGRLCRPEGGTMEYGDHGVDLFDSSGRDPVAQVWQGERWGEARLVCRRGLNRIPFLAAALDLAALLRGWVPLHGSAWVTKEATGVLVTGFAGSGKTGALLAACETGAVPVGDDRILLSADGSRMMGLGRPLVVKDWHLAQLRLRAIGARPVRRTLARASLRLAGRIDRYESRPTRWAGRALGRLRRELNLEVDPRELGGPAAPGGFVRPDVLVILETHRYPEVISQPVDPRTAASHIAAQVATELAPALRAHVSLEHDRPGSGWREVGRAPEMAAEILRDVTPSLPTFLVRHPHPCSLRTLGEVIGAMGGYHLPRPMST